MIKPPKLKQGDTVGIQAQLDYNQQTLTILENAVVEC